MKTFAMRAVIITLGLFLHFTATGVAHEEFAGFDSTPLQSLRSSPDEAPEQTLLRAYRGEPGANVLAITGYLTGAEGFPQNLYLAQAWSEAYHGLIDPETETLMARVFMNAMNARRKWFENEIPWAILAEAELAQKSAFAPTLRASGILNLEPTIGELRKKVSNDAVDQEMYLKQKERQKTTSEYRVLVIKTIRELRGREMTEADAAIFEPEEGARRLHLRALMKYLATDDGPETGSPSWSLEYLNQFTAAREKENGPELSALLADAARSEAQRLIVEAHDREYLLDLLRAAHSGDPGAIRQVAFAHLSGVLLKSEVMYVQWLTFGAVHHKDVACMELLAEHFAWNGVYTPGRMLFPMRSDYFWAKLAIHYGDKPTKERMTRLRELTEKNYKWNDRIALDKYVAALIKNMETQKGLIWIR